MKTCLNQKIDYGKLLGKVICKRVQIPKKWTSEFIKQHKELFIQSKNTKKVVSAGKDCNYLLLDGRLGKSHQTMPSFSIQSKVSQASTLRFRQFNSIDRFAQRPLQS